MRSVSEIKDPALGKFIRFNEAILGKTLSGQVIKKVGAAYQIDSGALFSYGTGDRIIYYADKPYRDRAERKRGDEVAAAAKAARETRELKRRILNRYAFVALGFAMGLLVGIAF